jgi:hypothetical protein
MILGAFLENSALGDDIRNDKSSSIETFLPAERDPTLGRTQHTGIFSFFRSDNQEPR